MCRRLDAARPGGTSPAEVDVAVGPSAARVCGWAQLAKHPELVERGLELASGRVPVDALEHPKGGLDRGPLAAAGEVRAQPCAEVAGLPDVERLSPCITKDVGPGCRRRAGDERALAMESPSPRCRQLDEICDRLGPTLLREPDERDQDLGRRGRIGERAVTWRCRRPEEVRERMQAESSRPAAEQSPRQPDRVDDGRRHTPSGEALDRAVEEAHVETRIVRDENRVAGEGEKAPHRKVRTGSSPNILTADACEIGDRERQLHAGIDERLERRAEGEALDALRPDLHDARARRREARRLEVEDHEGCRLERRRRSGSVGEPHSSTAPDEASVARHDLVEERARDPGRRRCEREQRLGRLGRGHRPSARLHELHEAVGRVEGQLHPPQSRRTYVRCQGQKRGPGGVGPRLSSSEEVVLVDGLLQHRAGRELRHGRRLDLDLLARVPRVNAHPRCPVRRVELAEPGEGHGVAGLQRILDGAEERLDCLACLALGRAGLLGYCVYELLLGHYHSSY